MTALSEQHGQLFWHALASVFLAGFAGYLLSISGNYVLQLLKLRWRERLSKHFIEIYLNNSSFYKLDTELIDNPDERITVDVQAFTDEFLVLFNIVISSTMSLFAQFVILWKIFPWLIPVVIGSAGISTIGTMLIGKHLSLKDLNFHQKRKEADFRYRLIRLKTYAEESSMYFAELIEKTLLLDRLAAFISNNLHLLKNNALYGLWKGFYERSTLLLPTAILAPAVLSGKLKLGDLTQADTAYALAHSGFSVIILLYDKFAALEAMVERLGALQEELSKIQGFPDQEINLVSGDSIKAEGLTLYAANTENVLVKNLSFTLERGESLAIIGKAGTGKSSILRAFSGIWSKGSGTITRPDNLMILPQQTYMRAGSFRDEICFPSLSSRFDDEELLCVLESIQLRTMIDSFGGLDATKRWEDILSPGQQQLLSIGRVLLNKPEFIFLDEATSALDERNTELVYTLIKGLGCTIISVVHDEKALAHHQSVLELKGDTSWATKKGPFGISSTELTKA